MNVKSVNTGTTHCQTCGQEVDISLMSGACASCMLADILSDAGKDEQGFDGHELLGEIARGGMGVVYRARQREPERIVALKTMRGASLDSAEARARFRHEAEVMVSLDHPAILPVYHFGEVDGIPFFTMKLADGGTLAERITDYSGKWREIALRMSTMCDAVRHAHERGVLHRDLKPGNVLFDVAGHVYVSDFGIAKLSDAKDVLTLTQSVLGTPYYLAPEVARDGPKAASVGSDVWSLGVMLFEMLTGRRPFEGETVTAVLRALDTADAPSVTGLRGDVPRDLAVICGKALHRDSARRYASALELAEDLRAWLEGRPIKARAVPSHERAWLWARRNPLQAALASLLAVAMIAAVASLAFGFRAAKRETERVSTAQAETQQQLRAALLHQARSGRGSREMGWRKEGIEALQKANAIRPGEDVRDELVAHLAGFDLTPRVRVFEDIVMPSSSLKYCLRTNKDTTALSLARLDDLENLHDLPDKYRGGLTAPVFDPEETWLVIGTEAGTRVITLTEDHHELASWPQWVLVGATTDRSHIFISQDKRWQAVATKTWQVESGGECGLPLASSNFGRSAIVPAFHGQSGFPAFLYAMGDELLVMNWRTNTEVERLKCLRPPLCYHWFGPLMVVGYGEIGQVFDYLRGKETFLGPGFGMPAYLMTAGNGTELLTSSNVRQVGLWHLRSGQRLVNARGFVPTQMAADGTHFIGRMPDSEIGRVERPEVMSFLPESVLTEPLTMTYRALAMSPDGGLLALHDRTQIVLHETASGRLLHHREAKGTIAMGFSADGSQLLVLNDKGLEVWAFRREGRRLALTKVKDVSAPKGRVFQNGRVLQDGERFLASTQKLKPYEELWRLYRDKLMWERQPAPQSPVAGFTDVTPDGIYNIGGQNQFNVINNIEKLRFIYPDGADYRSCLGGFSPDGTQLVFVDALHQWKLYDSKAWLGAELVKPGRTTVQPRSTVASSMMPAWAKSGRWFAVSPDGRRVSFVDAKTQQVHLKLESAIDEQLLTMVIAEDERTLMLQRRDGTVEVWHLEKLLLELERLGVPRTLPAAPAPKPVPEVLRGEFEDIPLPSWPMKWPLAPGQR